MSCANDPSIEHMREDLLGAGWTPSHGGVIWTPLWGDPMYGPHGAWHKWAGEPIDEIEKRHESMDDIADELSARLTGSKRRQS